MPVVVQEEKLAPVAGNRHRAVRGTKVRLFLTCWVIYAVHFSPYVYRELYLAMSLAEDQSVRVDKYEDLHPDLFWLPERGAFLAGNPGASILAAVPYWLTQPIVNRVAPVRPAPPGEQIAAQYKETRYLNRVAFYQKVRQRGLDVRLGVAAMITSVFFMAPLSALSAVLMFWLLSQLGFGQKTSLWLAVLYAVGSPIFFRTATLSHNLLVALLGFFSFLLVWWPSGSRPEKQPWRYLLAGGAAGWAVLTDFTGIVTLGAVGLLALAQQMEKKDFGAALRHFLPFAAGAGVPVLVLLLYQWYCFGSPWFPAQHYMPTKYLVGYPSEHGFGWPLPSALWGLLFDPQYGLLVFAPFLALSLYHFVLLRRGRSLVSRNVAVFSWVFFLALWVFCSCIHFTIRHQWQDGVRYLIPAVPFLFLLVADVLAQIPRAIAYLAALAAVFETWCLAMVRENPLESITRVLLHGFELPWLTKLVKMAPQYFPLLAEGASPLPLLLLCGIVIWGIWAVRSPWRAIGFD